MKFRLDKIIVSDFKRIETLEVDLQSITALVGGNTSGKSSALQAAQLGVSILQAALRGKKANGDFDFVGTVANDSVVFRPTDRLLDLRRGETATQTLGFSIDYSGVDLDTNAVKQLSIEVRRGKNANIAITRAGDNDLAGVLADPERPFSIFTPGLSGIPLREEWRTKGAMDAAVMHGDANLYLRTVLDHLFTVSVQPWHPMVPVLRLSPAAPSDEEANPGSGCSDRTVTASGRPSGKPMDRGH